MYTLESIEQYSQPREFLDLNTAEGKQKLESECNKLRYLSTYPSTVRSKIREKKSQINHLESELILEIGSCNTVMAEIKRRQELDYKFKELNKLKSELLSIKEELTYAEKVKMLAGIKLKMYHNLLEEYHRGESNNDSSSDKKKYRLNKLFRPTRIEYQ